MSSWRPGGAASNADVIGEELRRRAFSAAFVHDRGSRHLFECCYATRRRAVHRARPNGRKKKSVMPASARQSGVPPTPTTIGHMIADPLEAPSSIDETPSTPVAGAGVSSDDSDSLASPHALEVLVPTQPGRAAAQPAPAPASALAPKPNLN